MIRVRIFHREGRRFFEAQWEDPVTGRKRTRSTKTAERRAAERFAAKLEVDLSAGNDRQAIRATWREARERYELDVFPGLRPSSRGRMRDTFRLVERVIQPARLAAVSEPQIAELTRHLRRAGRSEFTVKGHLTNLRCFLRWAHRQKLLDRLPVIDVPRRPPGGMKGRAPTAEEFDRILSHVADVVGAEIAESWKQLIRGLWLSGLRLSEALNLHWTDDSRLMVDLTGRRPMFRIQAGSEKGRKFRMLPMTPDFYEFLIKTPADERRGHVFRPVCPKTGGRPQLDWTSKVITAIGHKAAVKVAERETRTSEGKPAVKNKWASAHDFRRAFGLRWSNKVRAPILMQLMRHASIATTMQFYIGQDANAAADEMWAGSANETANKARHDRQSAKGRKPQTIDDSQVIN